MSDASITLNINSSQAAVILYALERHMRHCDALLGENYQWPREKKRLEQLISSIADTLKNRSWFELEEPQPSAKVIRIY